MGKSTIHNDNIFHLVFFRDKLEDNPQNDATHFGILNTDENECQCLCCGGILADEDFEIIKEWPGMGKADDILLQYHPIKDEEEVN